METISGNSAPMPERAIETSMSSPKEERIRLGEKILIIPEEVRKKMHELDEFIANNEIVAEIFGWGLTRESDGNEERVEEFIAPDPAKIFNLKTYFISAEEEKLMNLLASANSLAMRIIDGELVIIPDDNEGKDTWLKIPQGSDKKLHWGTGKQNMDELAGFVLPEDLENIDLEIQKRKQQDGNDGLVLKSDWELILSGGSVIVTQKFIDKVKQRATETGTQPNFTMHHHPNFGMFKDRLKDKSLAEKQQYYQDLLKFSAGDLMAMHGQEIDLFEIRALGNATDIDSAEQVTSRFYSMQEILKTAEPLGEALKLIVDNSQGDTPESLGRLAKIIYDMGKTLEQCGYSVEALVGFYLGSDKFKGIKKEFTGDLSGINGKNFILYHLSRIERSPFPDITPELLKAREETQIIPLLKKVGTLYKQEGETKQKISNLLHFFPDLFVISVSTDEPHIREVAEAINHFLGSELKTI